MFTESRVTRKVRFTNTWYSLKLNGTLVSRSCCAWDTTIWGSKGGLAVGGGLSMWSEWGSSLIPLSLGEGDQTGDPETESYPPKSALKNSSLPWAGIIIWQSRIQDGEWWDIELFILRNTKEDFVELFLSKTFFRISSFEFCPVKKLKRFEMRLG